MFYETRFQNRRAKEKRLKKDSNRQWSATTRNQRMKKSKPKGQTKTRDKDSSDDDDIVASDDGKRITLKD